MSPDIPIVLEEHAKRLLEHFAPQLTGFDANGAAMMSFMLTMVAEEWDRAAARRVEENVAIRAIFSEASTFVIDESLRTRLGGLAAGHDHDLHIKALDQSNDDLRNALTQLHAHVESIDTDAAKACNEAIWAELACSVERRKVGLANF